MTRSPIHGFRGPERFQILQKIGSGGMGVVFEAHDAQRDETVALKTLHWMDPAAVYRFKKEFRGLADVAHRNLVSLYELIAHDDVWFFTMELVRGKSFLEHVRPGWKDPEESSGSDTVPELSWPPDNTVAETDTRGVLDIGRLRASLRQLAEGIGALHQSGRVHRDLKPSNVLVSDDGRVVVLDFGIAAEVARGGVLETVEEGLWGTAAYMAPEQYSEEFTEASDWYAVGVLLYEGLTGDLPFTGTAAQILADKRSHDPPRPTGAEIPEELANLCVGLLERNPRDRPDANDVLRTLGVAPRASLESPTASVPSDVALVGRQSQLALLEDAFAAAADGGAVSVYIHGVSGIGKTAVVQQFTDGLAESDRAVVLASKCYIRESVPYKGIDGVIDVLSRFLKSIPREAVEDLIPDDIGTLARIFPVLNRVQAIEWLSAMTPPVYDQRELRRRAFTALRHILDRIARERPVVVHIDDLQWADADSAELLNSVMNAAEPTRLLLIASFRSEDIPVTPFLQQMIESGNDSTVRIAEIAPLTTEETAQLARNRLATHATSASQYAEGLVREAAGNPFLIDQVVRFVVEAEGRDQTSAVSLGDVLNARMKRMPAGAREFLDVLAVAGQPLSPQIAHRAATLTGDERPLVQKLRVSLFLRSNAQGDKIGIYHDRIQEHLAEQLGPEATADIHRRLAECLEQESIVDPQSLYQHYLGMGDTVRAAEAAARIAETAQEGLAFDRAAQFYRHALELVQPSAPEATRWHIGLADALASGGSGAAAAKSYLQAAATAPEREALDLERRAGEQLLMTGRIDQGLTVMRQVLARVGLTLPPTPRRALIALILRRLRLAVRGLSFREAPAARCAPDELVRIDVCWAVAAGLSLVDNIQGASFQSLHMLLALRAGEPHRVARALALEAGTSATGGSRTAKRTRKLFAAAWDLADRLDSRYAKGMCSVMSAVEAYHQGRWKDAGTLARKAEEILTHELSLVAWEVNSARLYRVYHLFMLGEINEQAKLSHQFLGDAVDRQNVFGSVAFRAGWSCMVWLRRDDIGRATDALDTAESMIPRQGFHVTHHICMLARCMVALYADDGSAGLRYLDAVWRRFERSLLGRIQNLRINARLMRARCHLACAKSQSDQQHLRLAARDAKHVEREQLPWATALAVLVRAGIAERRGDIAGATALLSDAVSRLEDCQMRLWWAAAVRRKGELIGGIEGQALTEVADAWMQNQGVTQPEKMARALNP